MYFRQLEYYNSFRCVGGSCNYTCCGGGWVIDWTKEEIEKVKNAPNCSDELRALMNEFVPSTISDDYSVRLRDGQKCPMLTENGLCRIQRELGEEYLSLTCRKYPKVFQLSYNSAKKTDESIYRFCRMSCPEIAKKIVTDKNAMRLVNVLRKDNAAFERVRGFNQEDYKEHPEYIYQTDIFEFFYNQISDKRYSVETALINGAIAAQILSEVVAEKNYDFIPQALKELHDGFIKGGMFNDIENMKPDYVMKFGFVMKIATVFTKSSVIGFLKTPDGKLDLGQYKNGEANLGTIFDNDDYWLRNIALNLLFELKVPFYSHDYSIFESYRVFLAVFACIKLNAIASVSKGNVMINARQSDGSLLKYNAQDGIWGFASVISRSLCQNKDIANCINSVLKAAKFNSPASLAVLIK